MNVLVGLLLPVAVVVVERRVGEEERRVAAVRPGDARVGPHVRRGEAAPYLSR